MTNAELARRVADLNQAADAAAGLHPMLAAGKLKEIAVESLAIVSELARREIERGDKPSAWGLSGGQTNG